jgi:hypothetical protein
MDIQDCHVMAAPDWIERVAGNSWCLNISGCFRQSKDRGQSLIGSLVDLSFPMTFFSPPFEQK